MKKYKTIIIDGKKMIKQFFCFFSIVVLGILFLNGAQKMESVPLQIFKNTMPVMEINQDGKVGIGQKIYGGLGNLLQVFLQFDLRNMETAVAEEVPMAEVIHKTGLAKLARERQPLGKEESPMEIFLPEQTRQPLPEIPPERQAPIKAVDAGVFQRGKSGVTLANETSYQVEPEALLKEKPSITMAGDGPKVLVVHTHGTEAYALAGSTVYDTEGSDRSENMQENVVKVGEVFCSILQKKGIETLHDKTLHDIPSFNGSYAHSLASVEEYLRQYPSIEIVFDIHRDSVVYQDKTKAKLVTEIDGKEAAQLMFVVGTDQKGLEHPHWRENIKNTIHLQNAICKRYPALMRHINLRRERFNGHTTKASMIIEVGSSGNSLAEAVYGIRLAGECIADYLNQL